MRPETEGAVYRITAIRYKARPGGNVVDDPTLGAAGLGG